MIVPPRLRDGDTIGIVAPAGPVTIERLDKGLARLGDRFRIVVAPSIRAARQPGIPAYLAASDETRVSELHAMLDNPDVRAIILARGGYGLMRILPRLEASRLLADPKPIVGFSDATALLAWAYRAGVRGIHGPMIGQLGELADADVASLVRVLTSAEPPGLRAWDLTTRGVTTHTGPLVAANLTLASVLAGTPYALPLDGAIAVYEEVGERAYEVDRYLTHLDLTGARAAATVFGDFTNCEGSADVIAERYAGKPHAFTAPIGHGIRNEAVPFGAMSTLTAHGLAIDEAAVS